MLVLSRKEKESILIGNDIEISIVEVSGGRVKIGIDAPKNIQIVRKEVKEAITQENKTAISNKAKLEELKNIMKK
ncbi:MAG: carbon storage regulator CsrA [Peptostreptococcaceae bacterium]|jgi:carbon storage regulator|nr:carbon storage regulator CsrA [Peptostreptococcaceae bacterium]